jgi:hypothetical protein
MDTLSISGHKSGHNSLCLYKDISRNPILNKVGFRLIFIASEDNSLY